MGPEKQTKFCNIAVCPGGCVQGGLPAVHAGARVLTSPPPPVDGVWNEWSSWSFCSASCSNGTMQRTRECNGPSYGGSECRGEWLESVRCFLGECPGEGVLKVPPPRPRSRTLAPLQ